MCALCSEQKAAGAGVRGEGSKKLWRRIGQVSCAVGVRSEFGVPGILMEVLSFNILPFTGWGGVWKIMFWLLLYLFSSHSGPNQHGVGGD